MTETKKPRRSRVDSATSITAAILAAGRSIKLPSGIALDHKERVIFAEIIEEFPKIEVTEHQVRIAALLATAMAAAEREMDALDGEGSVLINSHGNAVLNPRVRSVQQYISSTLSYRRLLGLTARALNGGDSRNVAIRRRHNLANETILDDIDEDGLLARPPVVPGKPSKDN